MVNSIDDALERMIVEATRPLAAQLGETENEIAKALRGSVAMLVDAMKGRAADPEFADKVIEFIDIQRRTPFGSGPAAYSARESIMVGDAFIDNVFGTAQTAVKEQIAKAAHLRPVSIARVLSVAANLLLSSLEPDRASNVAETGAARGAPKGAALWRDPRVKWAALAAAAAIALLLALRLGGGAQTERAAAPSTTEDAAPVAAARDAPVAPQPAAIASAAPQTPTKEASIEADKAGTTQTSEAAKEAQALLQSETRPAPPDDAPSPATQPNGAVVAAPARERGAEEQLARFLERPRPAVGEFALDQLVFEKSKTELSDAGRSQLKNIATLLKANPKVRIAVKAYTDGSGNSAYNLRLSKERAENVMRELTSAGVDAARVTAQGFGGAGNAKGSDGKSAERRILLGVTRK